MEAEALQQLADDLGICIHVSHFPPGTSKWNEIEHRLFCHISKNGVAARCGPLKVVVELIDNTRTVTGLRVRAKLDKRRYRTGVVVSRDDMKRLELHRHRSMVTGTTNFGRDEVSYSNSINA